MGAVYTFDISNLLHKYNLSNYVETGTGEGDCLSKVSSLPFKRFISVEIHDILFDRAKQKFSGNNKIEIYHGNSYEVLSSVIPTLEGNCLFFLDAHFPGADFHFNSYESCNDERTKLPLEKELELLSSTRKEFKDIIIIDDLRIYMDGPYSDGNWGDRKKIGPSKCGFIFEYLNKMDKQILVDYKHQGYVIGY